MTTALWKVMLLKLMLEASLSAHPDPNSLLVLTQLPATFYDVDGTEIDLNDVPLNKRISKWRLALKFAKLIAKWGKRAWDYIYCVGANAMWKCADDVSNSRA
jgi:hypothetical protein